MNFNKLVKYLKQNNIDIGKLCCFLEIIDFNHLDTELEKLQNYLNKKDSQNGTL